MLTVNYPYNQINTTFQAKVPTWEKIASHPCINKNNKESYNRIAELRRKLHMDIDNATREEIGEILQKKSSSLPETMDTLFYNIGLYMKGGAKQQDFIAYYCKKIEPLYRRMAEGAEKELFNESYAPEIKMILGIRNAMNNINSDDTANNLDIVINNMSKEYLKTPITRRHFFAV